MQPVSQYVVSLGLICLAIATPATADPVTIRSGFVHVTEEITGAGPASLAGTRGFSLEGLVHLPPEGRVDPFELCDASCIPGSTVSITSVFAGTAVSGTVTLDGHQFEMTGNTNDPGGMALELVGTAVMPALSPSSVLLSAPFSLMGSSVSWPDASAELEGAGVARLWLSRHPDVPGIPPGWRVDQIRYEFSDPVPEPATMTLVALGLGAAALRARKRRLTGSDG
jgi:PEP-CTERM motif